jgi:dipeptidyl aminopeptidase/acylaminoacyl peptidase
LRFIILLFLFATVLPSAAEPRFAGTCDRLYTDGNTLWIASEDATRTVLTDSRGVFRPRFSPDGTRVAYTTVRPASLVVHSVADSQSRTLDAGDIRMSDVVDLFWRSNDAVWIEVHVSPIASSYFEIDAATGRVEEQKHQFDRVSVSPDGRHLVSITAAPRTDPRESNSVVLLDGNIVYPGKEDRASHTISVVTWAPGSAEFAFVEIGDSENRVMIVPATGKAVREVLVDVPANLLQWLPDGSLLVSGEGRHLLVDPVSGCSRLLREAEARRWSFVVTPTRSYPIEDRFCRR